MKSLIIIFSLVFYLSIGCSPFFAQEKSSEKCIKVTVERLDHARVKVTENNKCTNVITVRSYLIKEWNKIQSDKRKKKEEKL